MQARNRKTKNLRTKLGRAVQRGVMAVRRSKLGAKWGTKCPANILNLPHYV
jgi:hypothetical protein